MTTLEDRIDTLQTRFEKASEFPLSEKILSTPKNLMDQWKEFLVLPGTIAFTAAAGYLWANGTVDESLLSNIGHYAAGTATAIGGLSTVLASIFSTRFYQKDIKWDPISEDKKLLRRRFEGDFEFLQDFKGYDLAESAIDMIDSLWDADTSLNSIGILLKQLPKDYTDKRYGSLMKIIAKNPKQYNDYWRLSKPFNELGRVIGKEEKLRDELTSKVGLNHENLYGIRDYSSIYLKMIEKGWMPETTTKVIQKIDNIFEDVKVYEKFISLIMPSSGLLSTSTWDTLIDPYQKKNDEQKIKDFKGYFNAWKRNKTGPYGLPGSNSSDSFIIEAQRVLNLLEEEIPEDKQTNLAECREELSNIQSKCDSLFDLMMDTKAEDVVFSDALNIFKVFPDWDEDKKIKIMNYVCSKNNRQFASQFNKLFWVSRYKKITDYLEHVDELPSVGTKGQTKTLLKVANTLELLRSFQTQVDTSRLDEIMDYRAVSQDQIVDVITFLREHPDLPAGEIAAKMSMYYFFSDGDEYKGKWLKKGLGAQPEDAEVSEIKPKLNAKGQRKFVEELDHRVLLAQYNAFTDTIEDMVYSPIDEMLETKLPRDKIELNEELFNIIKGYHKLDHFGEPLKPLLRDVILVNFTEPENVSEYLDNLPGNKSLEAKLGSEKLSKWKEGISKGFSVTVNKKIKTALQERAQIEFEEFTRCVRELGYTEDLDKTDITSSVEKVYAEVSKKQIATESEYLLVEAKHHLNKIKQGLNIISKGAGRFKMYKSNNMVERMQMGVVSDSCTNIASGGNGYATITNSVDNNKGIFYMADDKQDAKPFGRTLAAFTSKGIVTYEVYNNSNLGIEDSWVSYFKELADEVGIPLIVPSSFVNNDLKTALINHGAKKRKIKTTMHKAECSVWYDDDHKGGRVVIPENGYTKTIDAYVL